MHVQWEGFGHGGMGWVVDETMMSKSVSKDIGVRRIPEYAKKDKDSSSRHATSVASIHAMISYSLVVKFSQPNCEFFYPRSVYKCLQ
jgi:hypothetical protein